MTIICLKGGQICDPANGRDQVQDELWMADGQIIERPTDGRADRIIDVTGMIIMPGGVDMHCHIVGPKVNTARKMLPDQARDADPMPRSESLRSGRRAILPTTFTTAYLYAGLGYTTAFDAAVPPLTARHAHEELQDTPLLDKGFYVLAGNNRFLMEQLDQQNDELATAGAAWLVRSAAAYALKLVNPGGVETWKATGSDITGLDTPVCGKTVTPRKIIRELAQINDRLGMPHPVHVHCNNLGLPGNASTTLQTMDSLEGSRGHLTHIQFHSYGGNPDDQSTMHSRVPELAEYVNQHKNLTVDVGQVVFGETVSMTGDSALGHFLHRVTGRPWFSGDTEVEAGCGIVPIRYRRKSLVHALQWAIGLEWYLLVDDPWQIAMSTDHPNGGSFLAYPQIIAMLMDADLRQSVISELPVEVQEVCTLSELKREYTLSEIAIITRAGPARMLGLNRKGHLAAGADADVTVYSRQDDLQAMFEVPRYVFCRGELVVDDGEIRSTPEGQTQFCSPDMDTDLMPDIRRWFEKNYTIRFEHYAVDAHDIGLCRQHTPQPG